MLTLFWLQTVAPVLKVAIEPSPTTLVPARSINLVASP